MEQAATENHFSFLVADNTNGADDELYELLGRRSKILAVDPVTPHVWRAGSRAASYAHGAALNFLFSHIETEIAIFVDPDCLFLMPGWDRVCIEELNSVAVVGAPYHARKLAKYHNFPSPIFSAFHVDPVRNLKPDWTPYLLPPWIEAGDQVRRVIAIFGARAGESVLGSDFYASRIAQVMRRYCGNSSKDTGWRIARAASRSNCASSLFTSALHAGQLREPCNSSASVLALMDEYELFLWQRVPILTHFYGNQHRRHGNVAGSMARWKRLADRTLRTNLRETV
jgi:hypothetical protein